MNSNFIKLPLKPLMFFLFYLFFSTNYIEAQENKILQSNQKDHYLDDSKKKLQLLKESDANSTQSLIPNNCIGCLPPPPCEKVVNGDIEQVFGNSNVIEEVCGWITTQSNPFYCNGPNNNALGFILRTPNDIERIGSCAPLNLAVGERCTLNFDYLVTTLRNYEDFPPRAIQMALLDNNTVSNSDGAPLPPTASIIAQIDFPAAKYDGQIHDACYREDTTFIHYQGTFTVTNPNNQFLHMTGIPFYLNTTSTQIYIDNISIRCCVDTMCQPKPDFTWHGCNPTIFEGTNTGDGNDYVWHFCDGTTAYGPTVSHQIPSGTECEVCLTVSCDSLNEKTICKLVNVECPDSCISATVVDVHCNNLGTSDPGDDYWYFDLLVSDLQGNGIYWTTSGDISESGSYGITKTIYPSGNIANNPSYTFDVFDAMNPDCRTTVTVNAPPPCSDTCALNVTYTIGACKDPGTPEYASDDQFGVTLHITGTGGQAFMIKQKLLNGVETVIFSGVGDQTITLPFFSQEGDFTLWIILSGYFDCLEDIYIDAPPTCSGCLSISTTNITCFDNGTSDPSDDYWTFDLTVTGGSSYWTAGSPIYQSGPYGVPKTIWVSSVSSGPLTFDVSDALDPKCTVKLTVNPPKECSEKCDLEIKDLKTYCENIDGVNYYFVGLTVNVIEDECFMVKRKNADGTEEVIGTYYGSQSLNFGPFSPAEEFTLWVALCDSSDCVRDFYIKAPKNCSNCIDYYVYNVQCYDNGTSDPSDDYWSFDIIVYGPSDVWTSSIVNLNGTYGVPKTFVVNSLSDLDFLLKDSKYDCVRKVHVDAPESCVQRCNFEVKHKVLDCKSTENGIFFNISINIESSGIGCFTIIKKDLAGNETVLGTFTPNTDFEIGPFEDGEDFTLLISSCFQGGCVRKIYIKAPNCKRGTPRIMSQPSQTNATLVPNPVKGTLRITGSQIMHSLTIYSIDGMKMNQFFINSNEHIVDTEKLKSGLYFVKIDFENNESIVQRFIKIE